MGCVVVGGDYEDAVQGNADGNVCVCNRVEGVGLA